LSPTARSLDHLRKLGFVADVCERWLAHINRKRDLFGVADLVAIHPRDKLVMLIQATTAAHVPDRLRRIQARPELPALLRAGLGIEVWGWHQVGDRWRVRRVQVQAEDLQGVPLTPPRRTRQPKQKNLFDNIPS
jgi:hypothetical protein